MNKIKKYYGQNYLINLIEKKGSQDKIGQLFEGMYRSSNDQTVKYIWFDFHKECSKMQWHNLSKLINEIAESIQAFKYGHYRVFKTVDIKLQQTDENEPTRVIVNQT